MMPGFILAGVKPIVFFGGGGCDLVWFGLVGTQDGEGVRDVRRLEVGKEVGEKV